MKQLFAGAALQSALQRASVDARFESSVNLAARLGREHDPRFGFAKVGRIELCRLLIVGVDLHGQCALAIEKLEQKRKLALRSMAAEKLRATLGDQFVQCGACKVAISHNTLVGAMIDNLPAFGVVISATQTFAQFGQSPATPQILAEDGRES
jgi:hypothetical protein